MISTILIAGHYWQNYPKSCVWKSGKVASLPHHANVPCQKEECMEGISAAMELEKGLKNDLTCRTAGGCSSPRCVSNIPLCQHTSSRKHKGDPLVDTAKCVKCIYTCVHMKLVSFFRDQYAPEAFLVQDATPTIPINRY